MLSVRTYKNGTDFLSVTAQTFEREEVANNLIYGIARWVAAFPERNATPPYLATVQDGEELICAAVMTPPQRLLLYTEAPTAATLAATLAATFELLIENLRQNNWPVSGVRARSQAAQQFAEHWCQETGETHSLDGQLRVFELRTVDWPPLPPGRARPAVEVDDSLIWRWYCDFTHEALPHQSTLPTLEGVQHSISEGSIYVWDNDGPVSCAVQGRRLPHGSSVGPVYTPPDQRGHGYASACVAALSQAILDAGADYCTLFTNLANPTSNRIYQRLGYRPVCDFSEYRFWAVG
jgi:GNAT superfamily N-acetyltransferase